MVIDDWYTYHDNTGNSIKFQHGSSFDYIIGVDLSKCYSSDTTLQQKVCIIIEDAEPSIDSRIKALKKELKYTRSVLEKKQIQQELNILYKERKNGHK